MRGAGCHQYPLVRPSPIIHAGVPEWSNGLGLGPSGLSLRRFESCPSHCSNYNSNRNPKIIRARDKKYAWVAQTRNHAQDEERDCLSRNLSAWKSRLRNNSRYAWVAQPGLEHHTPNVGVAGSNPVPGVKKNLLAGFPGG